MRPVEAPEGAEAPAGGQEGAVAVAQVPPEEVKLLTRQHLEILFLLISIFFKRLEFFANVDFFLFECRIPSLSDHVRRVPDGVEVLRHQPEAGGQRRRVVQPQGVVLHVRADFSYPTRQPSRLIY